MNNEHLQSILREYPMSMRLDVLVEKKTALETTVVEMLIKLAQEPPKALLTFCGLSNCILRERSINADRPTHREWLEMDMR